MHLGSIYPADTITMSAMPVMAIPARAGSLLITGQRFAFGSNYCRDYLFCFAKNVTLLARRLPSRSRQGSGPIRASASLQPLYMRCDINTIT